MVTLKSNRSLAVLTAAVLVAGATAGHAGLLTIDNASFESDVLADGGFTDNSIASGWTSSGDGTGAAYGVANFTTTQFPGAGGNSLPAPADGANVAYVQRGNSIAQVLSSSLTSGNIYTLTGVTGQRLDFASGQATVTLLAGGNVLAFMNITTPTAGTFATFSLTFDNAAGSAFDGQSLEILLGESGSGMAVFDNIALDASVPEPVNVALAMFGVVAVGGFAGRRYVASRKLA
jgi:hypothetical protein